jgi:hypothetical protein
MKVRKTAKGGRFTAKEDKPQRAKKVSVTN